MVAASSPFGLSKAALERRINNQIPRKRHTPFPDTKIASRNTAKHVARPESKVTPEKRHTKRNLSSVPQIRPEKRGTNRTRVAGTSSRGINQWSARRILASRPHPSNPAKTQYKVHWETTWESASDITGLAAVEWKEAVRDGNTFGFKAQDGGEWTVLKDATSLENDSEDSQWEMWRAIRRNVVQEVEKDWFIGLDEEEFAFASEADEVEVKQALAERWPNGDISPKNILRAAWSQVSNDPGVLNTDIPLGNIKVRYVAQLDPWAEEDLEEPDLDHRAPDTVAGVIRALVPNPLEALEDESFSKGDTHSNYMRWREITRSLVRRAPFMFRSGTWMQLFAFLVLGSETFRNTLASVGINVQDDWCQRAREYDMHMYYDCIVDDRSTHDIQETFLNLRDFFRDLAPSSVIEMEDKDSKEAMEPTESASLDPDAERLHSVI